MADPILEIVVKLRDEFTAAFKKIISETQAAGVAIGGATGKAAGFGGGALTGMATASGLQEIAQEAVAVKAALGDIGWVGVGLGLKRVGIEAQAAKEGLKETAAAGATAGEEVAAGITGATIAGDKLTKTLSRLGPAIIAYFSYSELNKSVGEFARLESARITFEKFGAQIHSNQEDLGRWKEELRGCANEAEILDSVNRSMLTGLVRSAEDFDVLAKAAVYVARTTGETVPEALHEVSMALSQSGRGLRQLGIDLPSQFLLMGQKMGTAMDQTTRRQLALQILSGKTAEGYREIAKSASTTSEVLQRGEATWKTFEQRLGEIGKLLAPFKLALATLLEGYAESILEIGKAIHKAFAPAEKKELMGREEFPGAMVDQDDLNAIEGGFKTLAEVMERVNKQKWEMNKKIGPQMPINREDLEDDVALINQLTDAWETEETAAEKALTARGAKPPSLFVTPEKQLAAIEAMKGRTPGLEEEYQENYLRFVDDSTERLHRFNRYQAITGDESDKLWSGMSEGALRFSEDLGTTFERVSDAVHDSMRDIQDTFSSTLDDLVIKGEFTWKGFMRNLLSSWAHTIDQLIAQEMVAGLFGEKTKGGGLGGGLLGGLLGLLGIGGTGAAAGVPTVGMGPTVGAEAWDLTGMGLFVGQHGGVVTRPTFSLIGEHGPEAVIPLNRLQSGTRGGDVHVNLVFPQVYDQAGAQRMLHTERRFIEGLVQSAMRNDRNMKATIKAAA